MVVTTINGKSYDVVPIPGGVFNPNFVQPGSLWTADPRKWGLSFSVFFSTATGFGYTFSPYSYVYIATPVKPTTPPTSPPVTPTTPTAEPLYFAPPAKPASTTEQGTVFSHIAGQSLGATAVVFNGRDEGGTYSGGIMASGDNFRATADVLRNSSLFVPGKTAIDVSSFDQFLDQLEPGAYRSFVMVDHASPKGISYGGFRITDEQWSRLSALADQDGNRFVIHYGCDIAAGNLATIARIAKDYNFSIITHAGETNYRLPNGPAVFVFNSTNGEWVRIDPDGRIRRYQANGKQLGSTDVWEYIDSTPPPEKKGP